QLARCPWCGSDLKAGRDLKVDKDRARTLLFCGDKTRACAFTGRNSPGEGLPVVVVDSEVYRLVPSLVIATVDKFALMPWIGATQALFGRVSRRCPRHGYLTPDDHSENSHPKSRDGRLDGVKVEPCGPLRPPDLVIQDELHLIAGPLGSLVGLYETAIDRLCSWGNDGHRAGPKLIASTATIRRARLQVDRLYARDLAVFPPPALDARDTFFSLQRDRPEDAEAKPGRRYLGICAPGRRFKGILIRVYIAMLGSAQKLLEEHPGDPADAYMTLVGYFNSLRELGGTRRIVEDDVQSRIFGRRIEERGFKPRGRLEVEELTSRRTADEIPKVLDKLGVQHQHPRRNDTYPIDVLLATNMISVGVDVQRLGAMIVAGQPKSTSEYIQATSRVGRRFPGLVLTVFNWARPRDLSHYETFEHYHSTVYRQVEALSVTPFAPMALRRGLTGVLAAMVRLSETEWNPNEAAATVARTDPRLAELLEEISTRAADRANDKDVADLVHQELEHRLDQWKQEQDVPQRDLVYSRGMSAGTQVGLLHEPDGTPWTDFTVPMSMRDVEPSVDLVLRERGIAPVSDAWEMPTKGDDSEAEDE
ncbi:MAG: helicase, partial [Actinomycetota bacterium]|nr:helicase [Actinomycetota bacterium]